MVPDPPLAASLVEPTVAIAPPPPPGFRLREVLGVIPIFYLVTLGCAVAGVMLAPRVPAFRGMNATQIAADPLFAVPLQLVSYIVTFLVVRVWVEARTRQPFWQAIEWNLLPAGTMLRLAAVGAAVAITIQLSSLFLPIPKDLPIQRMFVSRQAVYMMMAFGTLVAPLVEELYFRGLFYPAFSRSLLLPEKIASFSILLWGVAAIPFTYVWWKYHVVSKAGIAFIVVGVGLLLMARIAKHEPERAARIAPRVSLVITAAFFAMIHEGQLAQAVAPLLLLLAVGLVITGIRARYRSVAAGWIVHAAYNATLFLTMYVGTHGLRDLPR